MKWFLCLVISFSANASFIAVSDLATCEKADLFSHKSICESDKKGECVNFPGGYCQQYVMALTANGEKYLETDQEKLATYLANRQAEESARLLKRQRVQEALSDLETISDADIDANTSLATMRAFQKRQLKVLKALKDKSEP